MNCVLTTNVSRWHVRVVFLTVFLLYLLVGALLRNGATEEELRKSSRVLLSVRSASNSTETFDYTESQECIDVHRLGSDDAKCKFVRSVESCQNEGGLVNYVEFVFCVVPTKLVPLAMVFLSLWLLYLFVFLATTAQEFFCPSLQIMSEVMKLSQNVAGVTLLAFGNGAPDIFSSVSAIMQKDDKKANLAIGALFGAGMFVTSVVVGSVAIVKPFTLNQRPFLRDILFYLIGVFWTFVILWQNKVTIYSAVGLIAMYISYVVVVIAGRVIFQKWKKWRARTQAQPIAAVSAAVVEEELLTQGDSLDTPPDDGHQETSPHIRASPDPSASIQERECGPVCVDEEHSITPPSKEESTTMPFSYIGHFLVAAPSPVNPADEPSRIVANTIGELRHYRMQAAIAGVLSGVETIVPVVRPLRNVNTFRSPAVNGEEGEQEEEDNSDDSDTSPFLDAHIRRPIHPHPFIKLLKELWPFGEEFKSLKWTEKIYEVIKSPAGLILTLTIPVVDHEKPNDNWNKWLNVLHCVTAPLIIMLITKLGFTNIGGVFPVWTLILIVSTIAAIIVACTSRNDHQPSYHCVFAWIAFCVSVVWIYSLANEVVNLLQAFGVVIKLSDGILGLTFLAWGNSVGDAVSNVTMARQGFPRMAIGACFGGPLMNLLIAVGIGSVIKMATSRRLEFPIYFTQVELFAVGFLMFSLTCTLLVILFMTFKLRRLYGIFLIGLYITFLIISILAEVNVFTISIFGVISQ